MCHFKAGNRAGTTGCGAGLAMRCLVLAAFLRAGFADVGAQFANFFCVLAATGDGGGGQLADRRAIHIQRGIGPSS